VDRIAVEHAHEFPPSLRPQRPALEAISLWLHRDREAAFYGDIDLIPERMLDRDSG